MIEIEWFAGESKGYRDLLPDRVIEGFNGALTHLVVGPKGGEWRAKCLVAPGEGYVDLDYAPFPFVNTPIDIELGMMRILLDAEGWPTDVQWLYETWSGGEARANYFPGVEANLETGLLAQTDREATIKQRRGQSRFRKALELRWNGCCALTGICNSALLRASHITPWAESEPDRLNPANGLLLAAHVDALFDQHLLSFDEKGRLWINKEAISEDDRRALNLPAGLREPPTKAEAGYLQRHYELTTGNILISEDRPS